MPEILGGGGDFDHDEDPAYSVPRDAPPRPAGPSRVARKGIRHAIIPEAPQHVSSEVARFFKVGEVHPSEGLVVQVIGRVTVFSDGSVQVRVTVNWPEVDEPVRTTVYKNWERFKEEDPIYAQAMDAIEQVSGSSHAYITGVRGTKDEGKRDKWGAVKV